jgi:hypothetical protein
MLDAAEFEPSEKDRTEFARERFLTSHRALAACTREFGRLAQAVAERAGALRHELMIEEEPELRLTPERCIMQVGPVAITIAWLRGPLDSLADGRLLIIAWRGTIGRRRFSELPARRSAVPAAQTAESVWEESFVASAENEVSWEWQSEADPSLRYDSNALAARSIERLRTAWSLSAAI